MTRREVIALCVLLMAGGTARAGEIYRDPSGDFQMALAEGWTVTRRAMSEDVCPGWTTGVQSPADAYSRLTVMTCAVETDPNRLREQYYREVPEARRQDDEFAAMQQQMAAQRQSLQGEAEAQNQALRRIIADSNAAPAARQAAQAALARKEEVMRQIQSSESRPGMRGLTDPVHTASTRQRLLEETGRSYFRGYMNSLQSQGRIDGGGKVSRTTAIGRDAMGNEFAFFPSSDGKLRKGFALYLLGDGMTYFIAGTAAPREAGSLDQMVQSITLAH